MASTLNATYAVSNAFNGNNHYVGGQTWPTIVGTGSIGSVFPVIPSCDTCGSYIVDEIKHLEWHKTFDIYEIEEE